MLVRPVAVVIPVVVESAAADAISQCQLRCGTNRLSIVDLTVVLQIKILRRSLRRLNQFLGYPYCK